MTSRIPAIPRMNPIRLSALLAAFALSGCMQPATAPAPAPQSPASPQAPAAPRVVTPAAPPAAPPAPAALSGPVDSRTGLHQAALISVSGDADSRFTLLFRPSLTEAARIDAAPAQLCRQAGRDLKDSRTNTPGAGSAMPGVQMMIVTCSAA